MTIETAVIFDNFDNGAATCAVVNGDFSELHNQFVNGCDDEIFDKINNLVVDICKKYNVEEWYTHDLPSFPSDEFYSAVKGGAKVIITGCIP